MPVYPQSFSIRDVRGYTSWVRLFINKASLASAAGEVQTQWVTSMTAAMNGAIQKWNGPYRTEPVPPSYGTTSRYADAQDKLLIYCRTSVGSIHKIQFPTPKVSMFLADGETLDLSNGTAAGLVDDITLRGMCDRDGNLYTAVIMGMRIRVDLHRKAGLYLKNPQLTTPTI